MKKYSIDDIKKIIGNNILIVGDINKKYFSNIRKSDEVNEDSLDWINSDKANKQTLFELSKARVIICDKQIAISEEIKKKKCVIVVENPKLTFLRIANTLFVKRLSFGIHKMTNIDSEADIGENVSIGSFASIGKCKIGKNTIIHSNCNIYDGVIIGENVIIHSGTVIGADGFGYVRNERDEFEKFPHISNVIIEDDVEICGLTHIARGTLGDTIIEQGTKIDAHVHVGHNIHIGKHCIITSHAMLGADIIGDYSWVAPSACLRDRIVIGSGVMIGLGAVVTKDVPDGATVIGNPARDLDEFKMMLDILNKMVSESDNKTV